MSFEFSTNTLDSISADIVVIFAFKEVKQNKSTFVPTAAFSELDNTLKGQLKKAVDLEQFKGSEKETIAIYPQPSSMVASRIMIIGLGERKDFDTDRLRKVMGTFAKRMKTKIDSAAFVLPDTKESGMDEEPMYFSAAEGLVLGKYEFIKYKKSEKQEHDLATIIFCQTQRKPLIDKAIKRAGLYSQATMIARDLVNEQAAIATPTYLANLAKEIAKSSHQIKCKIFDKEQLEKMGMEAFLGVARASDTPPKFIYLEYAPEKPVGSKLHDKLAIVGKGITFDSGGINVKPGDHMQDMKMDMSGAACVLGIFSVIAELKPKIPVIGLIAATPNLISGSSLVPGDVVKAYNGKTIEILNTDAEGRVTLADSLSFAVKEGATKIIDFATLTGACMVALGEEIAGLFSNNPELAGEIRKAAKDEGEYVWEMPLPKEYAKMNKSSVADIANIPNSRYGGAISAALFLQEFVSDIAWAHLDIAGPAFASKPSELTVKGGTGYGVRMMLKLLETLK